MKRLVIHIGIEKTGTTSLQQFLYLNEGPLAEQGIGLLHCAGTPNNRLLARYADPSDTEVPRSWRHQPIPEGQTWRQLLRQQLHQEVRAMPAGVHTIVVSSEHLHSRLHQADDVRCVAELFSGLFDCTDIVVYLRRQDRLAVSLFSTALRAGWPQATPLPGNVTGRTRYYDFAALLERWAAVFGREHVLVRAFDRRRFVDGDLYSDFLSGCGWPQLKGRLEVPPAQNEALSAVAAAALQQVNIAVASLVAGKEPPVGARLRSRLADELTSRYPGPGMMPSRAEAEVFMERFAESNREVSDNWFGGQPLFDDDFAAYPERVPAHSLPPAVLATAMTWLVRYMQQAGPGSTVGGSDIGAALRNLPTDSPAPRLLRVLGQKLQASAPALSERLKEIARSLRNAK